MTNRKWLESLSDEEFARVMSHDADYCFPNEIDGNCTYGGCTRCALKWLTQEHKNPMPELKAGMFVKVKHSCSNGFSLGVIVPSLNTEDNIIVYDDGRWDTMNVDIVAVYKTVCFNSCDDDNCIWKKS